MTDAISGVFDDHARELDLARRERLADGLEALAIRVRAEPPLRGALLRDPEKTWLTNPTVADRWVLLVEWEG